MNDAAAGWAELTKALAHDNLVAVQKTFKTPGAFFAAIRLPVPVKAIARPSRSANAVAVARILRTARAFHAARLSPKPRIADAAAV